ncbi:MAG: hypothetical protein EPO02_12595 [Nitrospirae bacterium]|nr:MAG: hypothetical protein EPO02_12595 [Nitrospirota bacterium]
MIKIMAGLGLWKPILLKETVLWFCFNAVWMLFDFGTSMRPVSIFRRVFIDNIKLGIIGSFVFNTYIFPFPVEFIGLPMLVFIAVLRAVAKRDDNGLSVVRLTDGILTFVNTLVLLIVLFRACADFRNLGSFETIRSIILAPTLSILIAPLLYVMILIAHYEMLFSLLGILTMSDKKLKLHIGSRIILLAGFSMTRVHQIQICWALAPRPITTVIELENLITAFRSERYNEYLRPEFLKA